MLRDLELYAASTPEAYGYATGNLDLTSAPTATTAMRSQHVLTMLSQLEKLKRVISADNATITCSLPGTYLLTLHPRMRSNELRARRRAQAGLHSRVHRVHLAGRTAAHLTLFRCPQARAVETWTHVNFQKNEYRQASL